MAGYLGGGMQSLDAQPGLVDRIERITAGSLAERLRAPDPPMLIDVRAPGEWAERRIEAAVNLPLSRLPEQMGTLDRDRSIVVHCASGYRSAIAASFLKRDGFANVADLVGGLPAWESAAPVELA